MRSEVLVAAGGLGVFLIGMKTMTEGLRALAGARLARALAHGTRSPSRGALLGAGVTALIQSSSATTVAAVGFVGAGVLTFPQALGIVFGANLGTTCTGWIVATLGFKADLGLAAHSLVLLGALLLLLGAGRSAAAGRALAGFALLFLGLDALKDGLAGMQDLLAPERLPGDSWAGRAMLVAIGCSVTMLTQSSSAGVATALAALHAGSLALPQALALVIGMDVGTSFTAVLASLGGSLEMRRTGLSHLLFNVLSAVPGYLLLPSFIGALAGASFAADGMLALVAFHSSYNLLGVLVAVPLAQPFARMVEALVRPRARAGDRLDSSVARDAGVAVPACAAAALRLLRGSADLAAQALHRPPESPEAARVRTAALRREMDAVRADLGIVSTDIGDGALHERHLALYHAVDHVERLLDRLEDPPAAAALADLTARRWSVELASAMRDAARGAPEDRVADARRLALRFAEAVPEARQEVMRAAAAGRIRPTEALAVLDEYRRIERLAQHLWRALRYAARSRGRETA